MSVEGLQKVEDVGSTLHPDWKISLQNLAAKRKAHRVAQRLHAVASHLIGSGTMIFVVLRYPREILVESCGHVAFRFKVVTPQFQNVGKLKSL